jgi:aspartate aminotransferase
MISVSERMNTISPSLTLAITAKAKELKAMGRDVIGFGAGEPDFDTPDSIKEAAITAIRDGQTKYTPVGGTVQLKKAIQQKFERENGFKYGLNEITASVGGKQVLFNLFLAVLNPGDEVIIPAPYWVSYNDIVSFCGAKPVVLETSIEEKYVPSPAKLAALITPKTKMIVINSPSNPTGSYFDEAMLRQYADILLKHPHVLIVSDDIYEHLLYDGLKFKNILMIEPSLRDRTVVVNGVSKAYSMTGWRIGYGAGPAHIIEAMETIQGQSTSNPASIAQAAAAAALSGDQSFIGDFKRIFQGRRDLMFRILESIDGVKVFLPSGAFYIFPDISAIYNKPKFKQLVPPGETSMSMAFSNLLIEKHNVAVVPGIAFGDDRCVRLSYALGEEAIRSGVERIGTFIRELD